jgi:pimeloyl-ACP methyl ester carboxylesterase
MAEISPESAPPDPERITLRVGNETLACSVDRAVSGTAPSVLSLHGAGPSNREHARYLSRAFTDRGLGVVRFDFSGQGESTGRMEESSLAKRRDEAIAVMRHFGMDEANLSIVGTSMGGYVAAALAGEFRAKTLILFCPAAYDVTAWDVPFGGGFTDILRRDLSLLKSDVRERLSRFTGNSLLVLAERDEVIPGLIVGWYQEALGNARNRRTFTISDCPHPIHRWVADKPDWQRRIREEVSKTIECRG